MIREIFNAHGKMQVTPAGDIIHLRDQMALILEGVVKMLNSDGRVSRICRHREIIGALPLFLVDAQPTVCAAANEVRLLILDHAAFRRVLEIGIDGREVILSLCQHLLATTYSEVIQLESFKTLSPLKRVIRFLETQGPRFMAEGEITIPLTATEIGEIVGSSRPTVWRAIATMKKEEKHGSGND